MKTGKLFTAALLATALGTLGYAYAQDAGSAPPKDPAKTEWKHGHDGGPFSALPEDKRKLLKEAMEKVHKQNAALHEQSKKLHGELDALLVAPQFDGDSYLKKSAELEDVHHKMQENQKQALASVVGEFSQEERIELVVAQHMMHHMKHHMQHASWHHHHRQDGQQSHDGQPGPHAENEFQEDGAPQHVEEGM